MSAHIIDQSKTTEKQRTAWCGSPVWRTDWAYHGVDHVAAAIATDQTPTPPCAVCLAAIVRALTHADAAS